MWGRSPEPRTTEAVARARCLLARWHEATLVLGLCLRVLLGALLLERLARLLGHVLPRRFVGHDGSFGDRSLNRLPWIHRTPRRGCTRTPARSGCATLPRKSSVLAGKTAA